MKKASISAGTRSTATAAHWPGELDKHGPDGGDWCAVVAITRGGLSPAMIIARELGYPRGRFDDQREILRPPDAGNRPTVLKAPQADIMGTDGEGVADYRRSGRYQGAKRWNWCAACSPRRIFATGSIAQTAGAVAWWTSFSSPKSSQDHLDFLPVGQGADQYVELFYFFFP